MNDTLLEIIQAGARAADRATMTGEAPNRTVQIFLMAGGISVEGKDTRKGGGIHYGKQINRTWREITESAFNEIERAVEEVCAWLDRETGIALL